MTRITKIVLVILLGCLLVLIRVFEDSIFYDPLLAFFKSTKSSQLLPEMDVIKLLGHVAIRFVMNTVISLAIIWVVFLNKEILKLSVILFAALFILLFLVLIFLLFSSEDGQHMTLFYVRRFLIQPIFILVLIPAFYFQKKT